MTAETGTGRTTKSAEELAGLVRQCLTTRTPLVDYGSAHAGLGNPPPAVHVRLEQKGGILDHYERDMTVRVAAGMRLGDLQPRLLTTRQFLPIDADDDLTLGEIVHHNVYGGLRAGYGATRDLLLGLHFIDGQARDIHVGGRTVKNVAGYDVTRFMVGSLGEFGMVHEVTIRTYAVPEQVLAVRLETSDPTCLDALLTPWTLSPAKPTYLTLERVASATAWTVHVGFHGTAKACAAQLRGLEILVQKTPALRISDTRPLTLMEHLQAGQHRRRWSRTAPALVKLVVPAASTGACCQWFTSLPAASALSFDALPLHGRLFVGGNLTAAQAVELDRAILEKLAANIGVRQWHARPQGAHTLPPFAPVQPEWTILAQLKSVMDPQRIFNPGRFLALERNAS